MAPESEVRIRFLGRCAASSSAAHGLLLGSIALCVSVIFSLAARLSLRLSRMPLALGSLRAGALESPEADDDGYAVFGSDGPEKSVPSKSPWTCVVRRNALPQGDFDLLRASSSRQSAGVGGIGPSELPNPAALRGAGAAKEFIPDRKESSEVRFILCDRELLGGGPGGGGGSGMPGSQAAVREGVLEPSSRRDMPIPPVEAALLAAGGRRATSGVH